MCLVTSLMTLSPIWAILFAQCKTYRPACVCMQIWLANLHVYTTQTKQDPHTHTPKHTWHCLVSSALGVGRGPCFRIGPALGWGPLYYYIHYLFSNWFFVALWRAWLCWGLSWTWGYTAPKGRWRSHPLLIGPLTTFCLLSLTFSRTFYVSLWLCVSGCLCMCLFVSCVRCVIY